jgi:hypothetical protein
MGGFVAGDARAGVRGRDGLPEGEGDLARRRARRRPGEGRAGGLHCYTTPADIQDAGNLAELGSFCRKMGREARQGEIGLVVGDEYFAIRDFGEE